MAIDPFQKNRELSYKSYINRVRGLYDQPIAQTSTALILTLATIAFFGLAAIRPTLGTVSELIGELEEKREVDKQLTTKISALAKAQDEYLNNEEVLGIYDSVIPKEQEYQQLLLELEYLAASSDSTLVSARLHNLVTHGQVELDDDDEKDPEAFDSYTVVFTAEGDYGPLTELLRQVDNLERILRIESVTFSQNLLDDNSIVIRMSVTIRAFWHPDTPNLQSET